METISSAKRPLSWSGLSSLFSDPDAFFSGAYNLRHFGSFLVIFMIWANSSSGILGGFSDQFLTGSLNEDVLKNYLSTSKAEWNLGFGNLIWKSLTSTFIFGFGFFWFFVKANICGFRVKSNIGLLAAVYLYAEAVAHIPLFAHRVLQAIVYSDPTVAMLDTNQTLFHVCCGVLQVLSVFVSYRAVQIVFGLSGTRTKVWFRNLPLFFYGYSFLTALL
jgi:hypothetical protein